MVKEIKKIKVATIIGTRPEIIRLSRVINALDKSTNHILIHTGQNYDFELNEIFFNELDIRKPDYFLGSAKDTNSPSETIGNIISSIDKILDLENPDAFLVLGDTNSGLSVITAKRRKVPIFHMEAGNRCFDQRVPEEINRKIIDHTSDINLTYSSIAREYLLNEGFPADRVIKTGSPMYEVLHYFMPKINKSKILDTLNILPGKYFVVSSHREENIETEKNFLELLHMLNFLADEYEIPIIVSTHPRTRNKLNKSNLFMNKKIRFIKPLGFLDYIALQLKSKLVLSDSGTITEESSILNFPALNIRESHERPEGMEEGSVILTGLGIDRIRQAISLILHEKENNTNYRIVQDYCVPNVSSKVVRIIHSHINYVKSVVWKKY